MRFSIECGLPQGLRLLLRTCDAGTWHGYHLEEPYALIGTSEDCNVRLSDESIAPFHAYLQLLEDRLFICDLTERRGVMQDGFPLTASWVDRSSELQVGRYELRIDASESTIARCRGDESIPSGSTERVGEHSDVRPLTSEEEPGNDLILSMRNGSGRLQRVRSRRDVSLVGRSTACKFHLGSASVSNFHCSLVRTADSLWVVDLGSRSGTLLNGQRIQRARATSGSRIQVGRCRIDIDLQSELDHETSNARNRPNALIPFDEPRSNQHHPMIGPSAGYSEELIRDLVADVASSQQTAFEQARAMLMDLVASQERMHTQQLQSLHAQNEQLLEVIRTLSGSHQNQPSTVNLPTPETNPVPPSGAAQVQQAPPSASTRPSNPDQKSSHAPPPPRDPEIHNAWVRGQLHTISETLKKEQERGVKKLLRTLLPKKSDDALR